MSAIFLKPDLFYVCLKTPACAMHDTTKIICHGGTLLPASVATFDSINQIQMTWDIAIWITEAPCGWSLLFNKCIISFDDSFYSVSFPFRNHLFIWYIVHQSIHTHLTIPQRVTKYIIFRCKAINVTRISSWWFLLIKWFISILSIPLLHWKPWCYNFCVVYCKDMCEIHAFISIY